MDYERKRSENEDCGGWKSEFFFPERSDSAATGNFSDVLLEIMPFNTSPGSIHWSRTFGERAAKGSAHGAEEKEQVEWLLPLECRDAQQHLDDILSPELQQQQFCIETASLSFCCFLFKSGANKSPFADKRMSVSATQMNCRNGLIMYSITTFGIG